MDLIERSKAIDAISNAYDRETLLGGFMRSIALRAIRDMPSAQPERKTGKWILKPNIYGVVYCSECDFELHINNTNFCPNCGARMEVKHEA